jgi:hypothetical protein
MLFFTACCTSPLPACCSSPLAACCSSPLHRLLLAALQLFTSSPHAALHLITASCSSPLAALQLILTCCSSPVAALYWLLLFTGCCSSLVAALHLLQLFAFFSCCASPDLLLPSTFVDCYNSSINIIIFFHTNKQIVKKCTQKAQFFSGCLLHKLK